VPGLRRLVAQEQDEHVTRLHRRDLEIGDLQWALPVMPAQVRDSGRPHQAFEPHLRGVFPPPQEARRRVEVSTCLTEHADLLDPYARAASGGTIVCSDVPPCELESPAPAPRGAAGSRPAVRAGDRSTRRPHGWAATTAGRENQAMRTNVPTRRTLRSCRPSYQSRPGSQPEKGVGPRVHFTRKSGVPECARLGANREGGRGLGTTPGFGRQPCGPLAC